MIVFVEAVTLKRDANAAKDLRDAATTGFVGTGGKSLVCELLTNLELVLAGLAAVLVGGHGLD